ncbi:MAG TPA: ComF family protein [Umezawaea sp.]|nr:ComF family protein [Umezawaea sp.]
MLTELLDLLLPPRCAGCGGPEACCPTCLSEFGAPTRVPLPGRPTYALADYQGAPRELVLAFKERGRHDLATSLGALLGHALRQLPEAGPDRDGTWWLVPAPSRRSASRRRGGPHVLRLARAAARVQDVPTAVAPALVLTPGTRDSAGLSARARRENLAGHVRATEALPPPGTSVVLLDDVVTTGATAAECVRVLRTVKIKVNAVLTLTSAAANRWWSPPG